MGRKASRRAQMWKPALVNAEEVKSGARTDGDIYKSELCLRTERPTVKIIKYSSESGPARREHLALCF
jgi:hypothetical protein